MENIEEYLHIDWLSFFSTPASGDIYNVTPNPSLPFNWDKLYQEIADYDTYSKKVMSMPSGQPLIYEEFHDPYNEEQLYCTEFTKPHTDISHYMIMNILNDENGAYGLGLYRTEKKRPFTQADKMLFSHLGPLL